MLNYETLPSSFRDPSGFVFKIGDELHRCVHYSYKETWDKLEASLLLKDLINAEIMAGFEKTTLELPGAYKILSINRLPYITYSYEWCFSQLKAAALLTLEIQRLSLERGMTLKDASSYNIQFQGSRPVFIDTLSFEIYKEGEPWKGYKQFCQHFLAPLALMSHCDLRMNSLMRSFIDGIPLAMCSKLLPTSTWLNFGLLFHVHLHSKFQDKYANIKSRKQSQQKKTISRRQLLGIIDSLRSCILGLKGHKEATEWGEYYLNTNYSDKSLEQKARLVEELGMSISPKKVWDIGANEGVFSRIFSEKNIQTMAWDIDHIAVEKNYLRSASKKDTWLLPAIIDLTNPSSSLGWGQVERDGFVERSKGVDLVLSLALVHHLAISNNVPLENIALFLSKLSKHLLIEFVPKEDSQVKVLLASREDIFPNYSKTGFETAFSKYYKIVKAESVEGTVRTLYLMERI